jgi:hypothetical protein
VDEIGEGEMGDRAMLQGKKPLISSLTNRSSLTSPTSTTLANPTRGFGLQADTASSESTSQESSNQQEGEVDNEQLSQQEALKQRPQGHDFNRISMRPRSKNLPDDPNDKNGGSGEKGSQANLEDVDKVPSSRDVPDKDTENKVTDNKGADNKGADNKGVEEKAVENKVAENKGTENKSTDNKSTEEKGTKEKGADNKDTKEKDKDKDKGLENPPKDKADKGEEKAPNPNLKNMGEAPSPENAPDKGAEGKGEGLENIPVSPNDKAGEGQENNSNLNSDDIGKAANSETVAEKEKATSTVLEAQAQNKIINNQTAQLLSTKINFKPEQKEETEQQTTQGEDNSDFLEQQRSEASKVTNDFVTAAASRIQTITQLGQGVETRIQGSVEDAKAGVMEAVEQQKGVFSAQIAKQRDQAQTEAQATIAQIKAQHLLISLTIYVTTATSRQKIESEHTTSLKKVDDSEKKQLSRIDEFYIQAKEKYRATGTKVGDEAVAFGDKKAAEWKSQIKGKDDSFWKGPLSDNRLKARAKAAKEVAKQYKEGLIKEANKQADTVDQGKPKDIEAVREIANKSREQLQNLQKQSLENINSIQQQALSQATEAKTQLTQTANQTLQTTLKSLDQQEAALSQLLDGYGQRQILAIERDAQKAIASIQDGINLAAKNLQGVLQGTISQLQGMESPNPKDLGKILAEILAEFDSAVAQVQEQTEKGITASEQGISEGGQQVTDGIGKLVQTGLEESAAVSQEAKTILTNLNQGATDAFSQIQQTFTTTVTNTTETSVTAFGQTTQGVQTAFDQVNQNLDSNFQKSINELEEGLRGSLHGDKKPNLESDIQKYADEAAAKEKPRGEKVLTAIFKVVLVIAVIVVAVIVAPAAIGAVGALAGALGASAAVAGVVGGIVGGAIVGAVAGAVIQMGNNIIDGKKLFDDIGKAVIMGAIGGALGGLGAGLGNLLGQAGKLGTGLTQSASKFGIDVAFNIAGIIAGDLAVGNPITAESILIGAAIGAGAYIGASNLNKLGSLGRGIQGAQARNLQAGERLGTTFGSGIRNGFAGGKIDTPSVGRPDVNMPGAKSPTTETSQGGRSETDTSSSVKPDMNAPGGKQSDVGTKAPETNTSNQRSNKISEIELKPDTVNKDTEVGGKEFTQSKVPIHVDSNLPGNTVRVHYDIDPKTGLVNNIHMRTGPTASAADIQLHAKTVQLIQKYSGFSGRARILRDKLQSWITKNGKSSVGSRAWEAKLEVEKLSRITDSKLDSLSKNNIDANTQARLQADINNLQQQLAKHQKALDEVDTSPGKGYVAMEETSSSSRKRPASEVDETSGTPSTKKAKTSRQEKFEAALNEKFPSIDEVMKQNLQNYNQRNPYGKRSIEDVIEQFNQGKILNDKGGFYEPNKTLTPDVKADVKDEPSIPHKDLSPEAQGKLKDLEKERSDAKVQKQGAEEIFGKESPQFKDAQQKMINASEKLGETGADAAIQKSYPGAQRLKSDTPGGKSGEFDIVYKHNDEIIIIVEAKGGGATRGTRMTQEGLRAEQGTPEYRDDIVRHMGTQAQKTGDKELTRTTQEIQRAIRTGKLKYVQMSQRVDDKGNLVPEVSVKGFSNTNSIKVPKMPDVSGLSINK